MMLEKILNKGEFKDGMDEKHREMLPFIIVSLMLGASMQYHIDEGKFKLKDYFDMAEKIIFNQYFNKED